MTQVRDYVVQLEAHLAEVHRQSQRLIERQSKMGSSMSDFGASMVALGRFESGTLAQKFTKLGERADTLSGACQVSLTLLPLSLSAAITQDGITAREWYWRQLGQNAVGDPTLTGFWYPGV